ncbi:hypothetical protein EGW08_019359, partial [Elysia chlorotica]
MAQNQYYFIVNNEACCRFHLLLHDNSNPLYTEQRHLQQHQLQQQNLDLYIQQKTTPKVVNHFSPLRDHNTDAKPAPPSVLDITAGNSALHSYSSVTTAPGTTSSNQHHGGASLVASVLCPSLDTPTVAQPGQSLSEDTCPNVIYSYDGESKSFRTTLRDEVQNIFYPGPNATWEELRQVTSSYSSDNISVLCGSPDKTFGVDIGETASGMFLNNILNNTYSAITSTDTYTSNVSSLLQNMHNLSDVNFSIVSKDEYLQMYLGKRYFSNAVMVALMAIYSLIFFTGVVGNVCTCLVIARNRFLHTATNYYLFSLAISDVLTLLLALPQEMATIWEAYPFHFGSGFCIIKSFVSEMTAYASVLTITAFTIDRYVAICHPLRSQVLSSLSRAVKIIMLIWTIACACALPYPIHTRTYHEVLDPCTQEPMPESYVCNLPVRYRGGMRYMFKFSTFAFFVVPMVIITIMYALIGLTLMRTDQFAGGNKTKQAALTAAKAKRAVLKMLVAVVIAFFVCWAPFHAQRLMTMYVAPDEWTEDLLTVQTNLFYISGVLYFFSSTVNPFLYNVMSKRYRKAFKHTLARCLGGKNSD